jgi:hypothetical protein
LMVVIARGLQVPAAIRQPSAQRPDCFGAEPALS